MADKLIGLTKDRLIKQPETATSPSRGPADHLKGYRWQPGHPSPNPKGRPKDDALPMSNSFRRVLKMRLPKGELRENIEMVTGKLPKKTTMQDALSLMTVFGAMGEFPKFRLDIVRELREAVEGREGPREFTSRGTEIETATAEPRELQERILLGFYDVIRRRSELYGFEDPTIKSMARRACEAAGLSAADIFSEDEAKPGQS